MTASPIALDGLYIGELEALPGAGSLTGLFKTPADRPLALGREGLSGDHQADRANHGGSERALNHYPAEHYAHWQALFPERADEFVPAALGENLSTHGLTEADVRAGDIFRLGTARVQISQPRYPCWKIARRMDLPKLALTVAETGRAGWLYRVLEPGAVAPDDRLELEAPAVHGVTLARLWELRNAREPEFDALAEMGKLEGLADSWREAFASRLKWLREHTE